MMDKVLLLKLRLPEADVDLPGIGTIRVRGLSRAEVVALQALASDLPKMEVGVLTAGVVSPALSAEECEEWHEAATSAELEVVLETIRKLSGLEEGSAKAVYKSVPGGS